MLLENEQLPKTNYITGIFLFSFKTLLVAQQVISYLHSRDDDAANVNTYNGWAMSSEFKLLTCADFRAN
jgi:hypothetical protein